jgi:DNA-binding Lrp family transcriptional regulator
LAESQSGELNRMTYDQNEQALLNLLADAWEKTGPPGYVETSIIAERLRVSVADAKSVVRSLFVKGLVDTFAAYLTPEGYELARKDAGGNAAG